jgi:hypothetical protein
MQVMIFDDRPISRNGVEGVAGKIVSGSVGAEGSEAEIFFHNGNLVMSTYSPYSKIQFAIGGTRQPRKNERELDRPDDFFSSIQFSN